MPDRMIAAKVVASHAAAILLWVAPHAAIAFEQQGFRSGMSFQEATDVARDMGRHLFPSKTEPGVYYVGEDVITGINMSFCKDQLFAINTHIPGGIDAFASTVGGMIATFGQPFVASSSRLGKDGRVSTVHATWRHPNGEETSVGLISVAGTIAVSIGDSAYKNLCGQPP
jgi:hypothetical protein